MVFLAVIIMMAATLVAINVNMAVGAIIAIPAALIMGNLKRLNSWGDPIENFFAGCFAIILLAGTVRGIIAIGELFGFY